MIEHGVFKGPVDGWQREQSGYFRTFVLGGTPVLVSIPGLDSREATENFANQVVARMSVLSDAVPNRDALLSALADNKALYQNLNHTIKRCSELLEYGREARKKIIQLGGEDPGSP